jgi:hypothetical protein
MESSDELRAIDHELRSEIRLITSPASSETDEELPDPVTVPNPRRRLAIRSIASYIEAIANALKGAALSSWSNDSLSPAERALANDETYSLKENGAAQTAVAKTKTTANLLFAFRIYAKANHAIFAPDTSGAGWRDLRNFIQVRDRLTHPKRMSELSVTDEEIRTAFRAFQWFEEQFIELLMSAVHASAVEVERLGLLNGLDGPEVE